MRTPVALFIHKRPELLKQVFSVIREIRPRTLLIVADGPQSETEALRVRAARDVVEEIDWPCEVRRNYSETNLGCRMRTITGLNWVFDIVDEAIMVEDDCLPHPDFFRFCEQLLDQFRNEPSVLSICGTTPFVSPGWFASRLFRSWGCATWSDRWQQHFDNGLRHWPEFLNNGRLGEITKSPETQRFWKATLESTFHGWNGSWSLAWQFAHWQTGSVCLRPPVNLVQHIGYGNDSAHHLDSESDPWAGARRHPLPQNALSGTLQPDPDVDDRIFRFTQGLDVETQQLQDLTLGLQAQLREKEDVIQELLANNVQQPSPQRVLTRVKSIVHRLF